MPVANSDAMPLFSERRLAQLNRAVVSGRILPLLVAATVVAALLGTAIVEIVSPNSFDSRGDALWWAAQTMTTVGYGDVVPATSGGRIVAVVVMLFGVAAVSVVTAVVTAAFVSFQQRRLGPEAERHAEVLAGFERIERRLDELEGRAG